MARQIARILIAYLISVLAVGLVAASGFAIVNRDTFDFIQIPNLLFIAVVVAGFVAVIAFPGAAIGIFLSEWLRLRRWIYYGLVGCISGSIAFFMRRSAPVALDQFDGSAINAILVFGALGILAGTVYWLLAGRNAGAWRA